MAETNTTTETTVLQVPTTLKSLIEALVFAAQESLSIKQIQAMYEYQGFDGESRQIESDEIIRIVEELNSEYVAEDKPYRIIQIAGGYQFATLPAYADWLGKLYREQARRKLSQPSTETLAIIAYRQPVTKPEIESIRGVNCDYVLKTLLEKELVTIVGRATTVGRPLLYGTTKEFLKHFGLNDVTDLPRPREIEEILGESQFETERRMLEAQQGLQEKKEEEFKSRLPHIPKRKPGLDDEVKIIPRKRIQDLKVREGEDQSQRPAEKSPPLSTDLTALTALSERAEESISPSEAPQNVSETVPKSEKLEFPRPEQAPDLEVESIDLSTPADQLPLPDSSPRMTKEKAHEEHVKIEAESAMPADASGPVTYFGEPIVSGLSETESKTETVGQIQSAEPSETEETAGEGSDSNILREPLAEFEQLTSGAMSRPEQQDAADHMGEDQPFPAESGIELTEEPSNVLPSITLDRSVPEHSSQAELPTAQSSDQHTTLQPKTRWQTWKEKIQGFIRKLLG